MTTTTVLTRVTDVIGAYFPPSPYYTVEGRELGTHIHACYGLLCQNDLDFSSVHPKALGRVRGAEKFLREFKPTEHILERRINHEGLGVTGQPDDICIINGRLTIVEIKGGGKLPTHRLQTAAYAIIARENKLMVLDRLCVYLRDGDYSAEYHKDRQDEAYFTALVHALKAKEIYK